MGHLACRTRLARTGACRSVSQLGNAASDWKKGKRHLLDQAAKGGWFIPSPHQPVTEVISVVVRESVSVCVAVQGAALRV